MANINLHLLSKSFTFYILVCRFQIVLNFYKTQKQIYDQSPRIHPAYVATSLLEELKVAQGLGLISLFLPQLAQKFGLLLAVISLINFICH